jgi:hypothetical protein
MGTRRDLGTARWQRIRKSILDRDGRECQIRGRGCQGVATTVDHIVPHALGGGDDPGNLRAACRPCNSSLASRARASAQHTGTQGLFDPPAPPIAPPTLLSLAEPLRGPMRSRTHRQVPG